MKTINGVLIYWNEIKIGAGGCELFVAVAEGEKGQEMDTPLTLPLRNTAGERERQRNAFFFFNQQKARLLM